MTLVDWFIVGLYFAALIFLSWWLARRHENVTDYFLGGKRLGPGLVATSLAANQVSAISLIGAPAFVALAPGGGMRWLQYEFAVPLAMIAIMFLLVPAYRKLSGATIYELLEHRFGRPVRLTLSAVFMISRGLATGIVLFTSAIVLSAATGVDELTTTLLIGVIAIAYTTMGGIAADIISDAFQLLVLFAGTLFALVTALQLTGGFPAIFGSVDSARRVTVDFPSLGLAGEGNFGFWPMLIGGLFLYISYYGCDQSQAQRLLSTPNEDTARSALFINGLIRFPVVITYCLLGLALAVFLMQAGPGWITGNRIDENINYLVPAFILGHLPAGIVGFFMAGIFAATMSSIDSSINSLAAVTVHDFFPSSLTRSNPLLFSRLMTVFWGVFAMISGYLLSRSGETVIELVNKVGSAFYGPVLAVFLSAALIRRSTSFSVMLGLIAGLGLNICLWLFAPGVSWLWWNPAGFFAALIIAVGFGSGQKTEAELASFNAAALLYDRRTWILAGMFVLIFAVSLLLGSL